MKAKYSEQNTALGKLKKKDENELNELKTKHSDQIRVLMEQMEKKDEKIKTLMLQMEKKVEQAKKAAFVANGAVGENTVEQLEQGGYREWRSSATSGKPVVLRFSGSKEIFDKLTWYTKKLLTDLAAEKKANAATSKKGNHV